jgi:hypothetical protein
MNEKPAYKKPLPLPYVDSKEYWSRLKQHELWLQKNKTTGLVWYPPQPMAPDTLDDDWEWTKMSGRGTVYSFTVHHFTYVPSFKDEVPYNTALIELEEGARILSNVTDCANEDLRIGMPVEVWFDDVTGDVTLPKFRPV